MEELKMKQEAKKSSAGSEKEIGRHPKFIGHINNGAAEHIHNEPSEPNRVGASELVDGVSDEGCMSFDELSEEDTRRHRSGADLYRRKCDVTDGIRVGGHTTLGLKRKLHDEDCD